MDNHEWPFDCHWSLPMFGNPNGGSNYYWVICINCGTKLIVYPELGDSPLNPLHGGRSKIERMMFW